MIFHIDWAVQVSTFRVQKTGDPKQEYFSDGLTDELIGDLAKISGILVIYRNSAFTYKGKQVKNAQIAKELNGRYVLEGSVQKSGDKVRIRAQLIDGQTDHHLWAESCEGVLNDIFDLQDKSWIRFNFSKRKIWNDPVCVRRYKLYTRIW